jgi:hypothetical protein
MKIQKKINQQVTKLRESGSNEEKIECLENLEDLCKNCHQKGSFFECSSFKRLI